MNGTWGEGKVELLIRNKLYTQQIQSLSVVGEKWRWVPDWDWYLVSDYGRLISLHGSKPKLTCGCHCHGYIHVTLTQYTDHGKVVKIKKLHQLVLSAFVGPCPTGMEVNHKNGIRDDNRLENLEYCTSSENTLHAVKLGTWPIGERRWNSKYSRSQADLVLELKDEGLRPAEIARRTLLPMSFVCHVWSGRLWKSHDRGGVSRLDTHPQRTDELLQRQ